MNLTRLAMEKSRVTLVFLMVIVAGGWMSYLHMPRDYDPGFIVRMARVVTVFPGATPERVEQLVTDRLEKAILEMPELDHVTSQSKTGVSVIDVRVADHYTNMRPIWDKLRRKVERVTPDLPEGVARPVVNDEFADVYGILVGITGDGFEFRELQDVADAVRDDLLLLDEVAKVEIYGSQKERIFVEYANARLAELGLTPYQLAATLEARNILIPGGAILVGEERIVLEPSGNFDSVEDLGRTVIGLPGKGGMVFLEDIATLTRSYVDPASQRMRVNGKPALGLAVSMREGGNLIALGRAVNGVIERVTPYYPHGIDFELVNDAPTEVADKVSLFQANLLQSIGVVLAVTFVALGIRTGLVVSSLIPMAMLMALFVMRSLGIGIDQMSLASLVISLGMLVDNAIVMTESILVGLSEGKPRMTAALDSARELTVPLLTSSLTTAASFLPIYLAKSPTGEYTAPLFKVVAITLLCSWLLALTLTPMVSVRVLAIPKGRGSAAPLGGRVYRTYRKILVASLARPWRTLAMIFLVFVAAIATFRYLPVLFFPPSDRLFFKAELELPPGTAIETTEAVVSDVETWLEGHWKVSGSRTQGVRNWVTHIGQGGPRFLLTHFPEQGKPQYALLVVNLTDLDVMGPVMTDFKAVVTARHPDCRVTVRRIQNGPPVSDPIQIRLSGRDPDRLFAIVEKVKARLSEEEGVQNISDDWGRRTKKLAVRVDQPKARRAGVTSQDVATSLMAGLSGVKLTEYRERDKAIPVTLRSIARDRKDFGKLEGIEVHSKATGRSVPLEQVAEIEVGWQPSEILRRDRLPTVTISSGVAATTTANAITTAITPWLDEQEATWGVGYRYAFGGEAEKSEKANTAIMDQLPLAGFIILALLMLQFNSFRKTLIIMTTIPLALIGVVIGLHASRLYFGFMTLLGIVSLSGIVVNNAIVLIERIQFEMEETGLSPQAAIVEAGCRRMRPIFLTTGTTAFGMVPLLWGGGPIWAPMAVSIISGLLFSTGLTLGVVPILYSIFYRVTFSGFDPESIPSARARS